MPRVQAAVAAAIRAARGDPARPQQVSRRLGLDKTLAWKLVRVTTEIDAMTAAERLPGRSGLKIFADALTKAAIPQTLFADLLAALADFERVVADHAGGDRERFTKLLAARSPEGRRKVDEAQRKLAFQGLSTTWGVRARLQFTTSLIAPNRADPDRFDFASFTGLCDFVRDRSEISWVVASPRATNDDGSLSRMSGAERIDATVTEGPPIIADLCTPNLPSLRVRSAAQGVVKYELPDSVGGELGPMSIVTGGVIRAPVSRWWSPDNRVASFLCTLGTPAELLVFDLLVHRDSWPEHTPGMYCYSQLPTAPVYPTDGFDKGLIPILESPAEIAEGDEKEMPGVAGYSGALDRAAAAMGWTIRDFRMARFQLRYPPVPSLVSYRYDLSPKS
ncbi:MAG: hypothetical protein ACREJO_06395 [Phycisphaerales bacterium]